MFGFHIRCIIDSFCGIFGLNFSTIDSVVSLQDLYPNASKISVSADSINLLVLQNQTLFDVPELSIETLEKSMKVFESKLS